MLAGPRKRQKISMDPRNKHWIDDPNQFGRKLMEKMGWSDGKGLGMNEDGKKDCVKVSLKANTKGLGYNKNEDENWVAHQDDFNDLLSELHQEHNSSGETESHTPKSIEERSRNSKRRVHYKKFTRGKDLSHRSIDDMNCIFGKRSGSSTPQSLSSAPTSDNENDDHGVKTVTNTASIQDYFAKKMMEKKLMSKVSTKDITEEDNIDAGKDEREEDEDEGVKMMKKKKKKRKNKRKLSHDGEEETEKGDGTDNRDERGGDSLRYEGFENVAAYKEDGTDNPGEATVDEEEKDELVKTEKDECSTEMIDSRHMEIKKKKKKKKKNSKRQDKLEDEG